MAPALTIDEVKESLECLIEELSEKVMDEDNTYGSAMENDLEEEAYYAYMRGYAYATAVRLLKNHITQLSSEYERDPSYARRFLGTCPDTAMA